MLRRFLLAIASASALLAVVGCVAAAFLAGWGGWQPSIGAMGAMRRWLVRVTAVSIAAFSLVFTAPVGADSPVPVRVGSSESLSGFATNALVHAYDASGLEDKTPVPFRLEPYIVTIGQTSAGHYEVQFWGETTDEHRDLYVQGKTGAVVPWSQLRDLVSSNEVALPGISAGAIIAADQKALSDPEISPPYKALLKEGAYNLNYALASGMTYIAFIWLTDPPDTVSLSPSPTPAPNGKCLPGGCNDRFAYFVDHRNGRFRVWNAARMP